VGVSGQAQTSRVLLRMGRRSDGGAFLAREGRCASGDVCMDVLEDDSGLASGTSFSRFCSSTCASGWRGLAWAVEGGYEKEVKLIEYHSSLNQEMPSAIASK
jgi:hypothetical protein